MTRTYVLFHSHCYDGHTAAWVAWSYFNGEEDVEYHGVAYGQPMPAMYEGSDVYIIDFSYPRNVLEELRLSMNSVVVLDHHKTAMQDLSGLSYAIFDMERSGCGLAWDYFFPDEKRPLLVDYMEDRDLWRFNLPYSKEVFNYAMSLPMTFDMWDMFSYNLEEDLGRVVDMGTAIGRYRAQVIDKYLETQMRIVEIGGYDVPVINVPKEYGSEACHVICERLAHYPFSAYYVHGIEGTYFGARSIGDFDVSTIARIYGGGGHKNAAGWQFPNEWISADDLVRRGS